MTDVVTRPRRGRPRDDRLDEIILEATIAEVAEKGFAATSIEGIAARAGVGKGTIYRRWRGKDELFRFAATRFTDLVEGIDTGELRGDLVAIFEPMADRLMEPQIASVLPALIAEAAQDEVLGAFVQTYAHQRRDAALAAIDRAVARGEIEPGTDAGVLADLVAGALVYRRLLLGEPTDATAAHAIVDQAIRGLTVPDRRSTP
jgi:AcrR family transcriptional regulator